MRITTTAIKSAIIDKKYIIEKLDKVSNVDTILDLPILFSDEYQFSGWYKDKDYKNYSNQKK